jgi:hypothetical protein
MSLFLTQVTAQAKRCNSPPDKSSILRFLIPVKSIKLKYNNKAFLMLY